MTILRDPGGERLFLEGRLEGVSVPDLIHATCLPGKTGLLTLSHGEVTKTIYIQKGQLIFASSNVAEERLGETLLRSGAIGSRQLEQAVARLGGGKRLGAIMVELGYLEPANLVRGLLHQVKEIILSLFTWRTGAYRFVEGPLPTDEVITLNIATSKLICDGIRRINSWPRIAHAVGSSRTAYRLTRDGKLIAAELDLGEAERSILAVLEEPVSVGQICHTVFMPNFDVYQYLWAFRILGIIRQVEIDPGRTMGWAKEGERRGTLPDMPIANLLLELARERETGILHLTRDDEEKTIHVKEGAVLFATSNRADEHLTTFLLRRGVIALRDKEEIERRVLTNKRVGTLLKEMGILSQDELARFVREQMLEIVVSVFAWERGDWRFVPGELPTVEDITLNRPVEDLVLHGIRAVRDWSRVRVGCGELGTILAPTANAPALLSTLEMGADEKEIASFVRSPMAVHQIFAATQVADFRAAQVLWALQALGALERRAVKSAVSDDHLEATIPPMAREDASRGTLRSAWGALSSLWRPSDELPSLGLRDDPAGSRAHAASNAPSTTMSGATRGNEPSTMPPSMSSPMPSAVRGTESAIDSAGVAGGRRRSDARRMEPRDADPAPEQSGRDHSIKAGNDGNEPAARASMPEHSSAFTGTRSGSGSGDSGASHDAQRASSSAEPASPASPGSLKSPLEAVGTGVLEEIERFNRRHREVYAVLKGAVGAGARNMISNCAKRLPNGGEIFASLAMDETGAFPPDPLFERVGSQTPELIRERLEPLIEEEIRFASTLLDPRTVEKLRKRLETIVGEPVGQTSH